MDNFELATQLIRLAKEIQAKDIWAGASLPDVSRIVHQFVRFTLTGNQEAISKMNALERSPVHLEDTNVDAKKAEVWNSVHSKIGNMIQYDSVKMKSNLFSLVEILTDSNRIVSAIVRMRKTGSPVTNLEAQLKGKNYNSVFSQIFNIIYGSIKQVLQ